MREIGFFLPFIFFLFSFLIHSFILLYLFILYYSFPHSLGFPKDDTELLTRMKLGRKRRKVVKGEKSVSEGISFHSDSLKHLQLLDFSKNSLSLFLSLTHTKKKKENFIKDSTDLKRVPRKKLSDTG